MKIFKYIFSLLFGILTFCQFVSASEQESAFSIGRVWKVDKQKSDAGRVVDYSGKRHFDKFYQQESQLTPEEVGEEYMINWNAQETSSNITLKFEYIPVKTTDIKIEEIQFESVQEGPQRTVIEHKGASFQDQGRIRSWRVSILQGDKILARRESSFWPSRLSQ